MSDYAMGIYFFTLWANAGGVSAVAVREHAVKNLGAAYITELGKTNRGINFGTFSSVAEDAISDGASALSPSIAEINSAVIKAAGVKPSLLETIIDTGADLGREVPGAIQAVGNWSSTIVIGAAVIALVVGVIYLGGKGVKLGKPA